MQLNPSEISEIIKGRIEKLDVTSQARNEGTVVSVSDGNLLPRLDVPEQLRIRRAMSDNFIPR
mgnify:CR=1 FL=1